MNKYEEKIITMADIQVGDKVMGTDGQWCEVLEVLSTHIPNKMYKFITTNGFIECSGDHEWTLFWKNDFNNNIENKTFTTDFLFKYNYYDCYVGFYGGPKLISIKEIEPKPCRCIRVNSLDHQFEIIANIDEDVTDEFINEFEIEIENRR